MTVPLTDLLNGPRPTPPATGGMQGATVPTGPAPTPPAAPARPPSVLEDLLDGGPTARTLRARELEAQGITPQRQVEAIRLGLETGLAPDLVARNFDAIKAETTRPAFNPERFAKESPIVAAWMAEEPGRVAFAAQDAEPLGRLERLIGRWETTPMRTFIPGFPSVPVPVLAQTRPGLVQQEYRRSQFANEAGRLGWQVAMGEADLADPTTRAEADRLLAQANVELPESVGMFETLVRGSASLAPSILNSLIEGAKGASVGATAAGTAAAVAGQAGPQVAVPEEIVTVPGAAAAGALVGGTAGAFLASAEMEGGLLTLNLLSQRDADGRQMDPTIARTAGVAYGIAAGILDVIGLEAIAKPFGKAVGRRLAAEAVRDALAKPTVRDALVAGTKDWMKAVGSEAVTETAQQGVSLWTEQMAGQLSNITDDTDFDPVTFQRTVRELSDTFTQTIVGMALLGVPGAATTTVGQLGQVRQAKRDTDFLSALGATAEAVSFRESLPEALREVAEKLTEKGAVRDIAIPIERFNVYWQEQGLDPAEVASQILGDTAPYEQAMALGTADLVIPLPAYIEKVAGTQHHAKLSPDIRLRPGALTARESQMLLQRDAVVTEQMRTEAQTLLRDATADPSSVAVYDATRQALVASGRYTEEQADAAARIDQAFFTRMAPIFGTDAFSLYERKRGGIVGPDVAEPLFDAIKRLQRAERAGDAAKVASARAEVEALSGLAMSDRRTAAPMPMAEPGAPATPAEVDQVMAERAARDAERQAAIEAAKPRGPVRDTKGRIKTNLSQADERELVAEYLALEDAQQADMELASALPEIELAMEQNATGRPLGYARAKEMFGTAEDARRWKGMTEEQMGALSDLGLTPQDVSAMMQARDRAEGPNKAKDRIKAELDKRGIDPMQARVDEAATSFDPRFFEQAMRMVTDHELGWWGDHSGSRTITGAAARVMNLDPAQWRYSDDASATRLAGKFLAAIYEGQSEDILYHGRAVAAGTKFVVGERIDLPTTATSTDPQNSVGYGVQGPTDPKDARGGWELQTSIPTMFEFAVGTPAMGYMESDKETREEYKTYYGRDIGAWDEALVAGAFVVEGVSIAKGLSTAWWNPDVQVVRLRPIGRFSPSERRMVPLEGAQSSPRMFEQAAAESNLGASRNERVTASRVVLSPEEKTAIADAAALAANVESTADEEASAQRFAERLAAAEGNEKKTAAVQKARADALEKAPAARQRTLNRMRAEIEAYIRNVKAAHPSADGWVPPVYNGAKIDDNGKLTHKWKTVAYGFASKGGELLEPGTRAYATRVTAIARATVDEVRAVHARAQAGDKVAQQIIRQAGWYKNMRLRLRQEFGGLGDLFADLLGATSPNTPVRDNWTNAVDVLRRAVRGDFDAIMPKLVERFDAIDAAEIEFRGWFDSQLALGRTKKAIKEMPEWESRRDALKELRAIPDSELPVKESGKKYGFNGRNAARALVGLWRTVKEADPDIKLGGTAPKALNFSGNLIGFRERATIDVWAARMLQRLAGLLRLPSVSETSVGGEMLPSGETTGQFGFGQAVFDEATALVRADATLKTDPVLAEVNADDLQALVWFIEKEIWTKNDWTSAAGEGGSFEFEADLTGTRDDARVTELRRIADSTRSTPEARAEAAAELSRMKRTVDRYQGGLSAQTSVAMQGIDYVPDDAHQSRIGNAIRGAIYEADPESLVLASKALSTEGRYFGDTERSVDIEAVVKDGYDPSELWASLVRVAQTERQDSTYLSRVLRAGEDVDPAVHRPGLEIYFRTPEELAAAEPRLAALVALLNANGEHGFTLIVDGRPAPRALAGAMPPVVGVRLQYIPEFDQRFRAPDAPDLSKLTEGDLADIVQKRADALDDLAHKVMSEVDGLSLASKFWYDTRVAFSHEYQGELDGNPGGTAEEVAGASGRGAWRGRAIREGVAAADRQSRIADAERAAAESGDAVRGDATAPGQPLAQDANALDAESRARSAQSPTDIRILEQTAFHGTPHVWAPEPGHPFGRVRADKVGTGEGHAAYGWGVLYAAEDELNATGYRNKLAGTVRSFAALSDADNAALRDIDRRVEDLMFEKSQGGTLESERPAVALEALARVEERAATARARAAVGDDVPADVRAGLESDARRYEAAVPAMRRLVEGGDLTLRVEKTGAVYRVDIADEAVATFLDWDKPLSEQPAVVGRAEALVKVLLGKWGSRSLNETDTGERAYRTLVDVAGSKEAASKALLAAGIRGIRYLDGFSRSSGDGTRNLVVFDENDVTITHRNGTPVTAAEKAMMLEQVSALFQGRGRPNAFILPGTGKDLIALMSTANASSILHELSHEYLEVLADAAEADNAPQWVRDDWQTALKFLGITSRAELTTAQHEQWARTWEGWLSTGKAPSEALFSAFARFKVWFRAVYKVAQELLGLQGKVNPEIAGVFSRLLASDAEISAAEQAVTTPLLFPTAAEAGATDAEFAALQAAKEEAHQRADASLTARILDEQRRASNDWWQEERARIRQDVEAEVNDEPDQRAAEFLRSGTLLDGAPLPDGVVPMKLDRGILTARYGPDVVKSLPRGVLNPKGVSGADPDAVAALFGIPTGDRLVADLQALEPRVKRIERLTDERMNEEYPDLLKDSAAMAQAAQDAVHLGDAAAEVMVAELGLLGRKAGAPITESIPALRAQVEEDVRNLPINRLEPFRFQQGEAKASRLAYDAARRQDYAAAQFWKRKQLLNHLYYAAARDAVQRSEAIATYARRFEQPGIRARLGKSGADYLEQIDAILEQYEFRRVGERTLAKRPSLLAWVEAQQANGSLIQIDERLLSAARRINYRQLSVDELEAVREALTQIDHLSRTKSKLMASVAKRSFEETVDAVVAAIGEHHEIQEDTFDYAPDKKVRTWAERLKTFDAKHVRPEFLFRWLDGDKELGPVHEALFQPIAAAEAEEQRMFREAAAHLDTLFGEAAPAKDRARWFSQRIDIPGIPHGPFSKATILSLALNWGNEGNREAIRQGHRWTDGQVATILRTLTVRDWQLVQSLWDYIDGYWPQIADLQRDMTGIVPAKVERVPFTVMAADGTAVQMKGGYYPLKYDSKRQYTTFSREQDKDVKDLFGTNHISPATRKGHTIERTASGGQIVALDLSVLTEHVQNVVHDLTHRKVLIDTDRLLRDERVQHAIEGTAGKALYRTLRPWLQNIASDRRDPAAAGERLAARARVGATVVNMGWKVTTALVQPLGFLQTVEVLGAKYTARGVTAFFDTPEKMKATVDLVLDKSEAMRNRRQSFDREVRDLYKNMAKAGPISGVQQSFFYATGMMDMMVAVPTWYGAYLKSMETMAPGDEAAAVAYADQTVRLSQGSGSAKDLANIQTGSEYHRLFTMFYSYFSVLYNLMRRSVDKNVVNPETRDLPRFAASMMLLWFLPAVLNELIVDRGPGDDEDAAEWAAWKLAKYPLSSVVFVRDVVNALGPNAYDYELSPAVAAGKTLVGATNSVMTLTGQVLTGEEIDVNRSDLREGVMALGYWGHLPARQMWITGEYLYRWTTGEQVPGSVLEAARGMAFAPKR